MKKNTLRAVVVTILIAIIIFSLSGGVLADSACNRARKLKEDVYKRTGGTYPDLEAEKRCREEVGTWRIGGKKWSQCMDKAKQDIRDARETADDMVDKYCR